jgi:hypothetical protein
MRVAARPVCCAGQRGSKSGAESRVGPDHTQYHHKRPSAPRPHATVCVTPWFIVFAATLVSCGSAEGFLTVSRPPRRITASSPFSHSSAASASRDESSAASPSPTPAPSASPPLPDAPTPPIPTPTTTRAGAAGDWLGTRGDWLASVAELSGWRRRATWLAPNYLAGAAGWATDSPGRTRPVDHLPYAGFAQNTRGAEDTGFLRTETLRSVTRRGGIRGTPCDLESKGWEAGSAASSRPSGTGSGAASATGLERRTAGAPASQPR